MLNIYCELMNTANYVHATELAYKLKFENLTKDSYQLIIYDSIISGNKYKDHIKLLLENMMALRNSIFQE